MFPFLKLLKFTIANRRFSVWLLKDLFLFMTAEYQHEIGTNGGMLSVGALLIEPHLHLRMEVQVCKETTENFEQFGDGSGWDRTQHLLYTSFESYANVESSSNGRMKKRNPFCISDCTIFQIKLHKIITDIYRKLAV